MLSPEPASVHPSSYDATLKQSFLVEDLKEKCHTVEAVVDTAVVAYKVGPWKAHGPGFDS